MHIAIHNIFHFMIRVEQRYLRVHIMNGSSEPQLVQMTIEVVSIREINY